jgi:hypothetical protein
MKVLRILLLSLVVLLIVVRIALPWVITRKANAALKELPDYTGRLQDVDLSVLRGAVRLEDLRITSRKGDMAVTIPYIDLDLGWLRLIKGIVVADVVVDHPRVRMLIEKPSEAAEKAKEKGKEAGKEIEKKTGKSLPDLLRDLIPFQLHSFTLRDGVVRFRESGQNIDAEADKDDQKSDNADADEKEQGLEIRLTDLQVQLHNLTNTAKEEGTLFAKGEASAHLMNEGRMDLNLRLNPLAETPTFDMNFEVQKFDLRAINPLLRWQAGVDVTKGQFAMFAEAAAAKGAFEGYVKPVIENLDVLDTKTDKGVLQKAKEAVVGAVAAVLTNPKKERIAAKIPFSGRFDNPDIGLWQAVVTVLRNAFIRALMPKLDRSVDLQEVRRDAEDLKNAKTDKNKDKKKD